MLGLFSLMYGAVAYFAAVVTLLYLIGFTGNLIVPKTVDVGPDVPWTLALTVDATLLVLFGLQHSVMARESFKRRWTRVVPPAVERSTYLVATCMVLGLLFWLWRPIAGPIVWRVDAPSVTALLWSLFASGWTLVLVSTFLIDHFELFGLRQVLARWAGRPMPTHEFRTPFLYRHVRHPLYLGILLGVWSAPVMTAGRLLFASGTTAYILVGIAFEERDLMARFGERYRRYRREVGMLVPRLTRS
jgi:protein-S-isoprenylcysteine O-methyltransferase Ste14